MRIATTSHPRPASVYPPDEADAAERPGRVEWQGLEPLLVPCGLLVAGAAIGFPFTLDARVAGERLIGLVLASLLAIAAVPCLRQVPRPAKVLGSMAIAAGLGGLWVISASGPEVFRGSLGAPLQLVFRPMFGLAQANDPIEVANTRFIVGYNGLADLGVVIVFSCAGMLLEARRAVARSMLLVAIGIAVLVLLGAGGRGGLTGVVAGLCAIGVYAWPRRHLTLALVGAPIVLVGVAATILDKGLEFSSTAGRLSYWADLARLLTEYPLTGVGLGVDTAYRISVQYEINPDPGRVFYAHNTFVQSYLESGPLGAIGMLLVPAAAVAAALVARRFGVVTSRRGVFMAGLGVVGGLTAHGLTDQVVTTNVGSGLILVGLAAVVAALTPRAQGVLAHLARRTSVVLAGLAAVTLLILFATPAGRAQMLLDLGSLQLNKALALEPQSPDRAARLVDAQTTLVSALLQDASHPAVSRQLARVSSAQFDDAHALEALRQAVASPRIDAFDMLQIAHLYRDLGFANDAYAWASRAYLAWGRPTEDSIMQAYASATLAVMDDYRARTLADQAEAAMRARRFGEARALFDEALTFQPESTYLQDRLGAAQRAVNKYGEYPG